MNIDWELFAERVPLRCVIRTPVWRDEEGVYGGDEGMLLEYRPFGCFDHLHSDTLLLFPEHELRDVNLRIQEISTTREEHIDATEMQYFIDNHWQTFGEVMK